MDCVNGGGRFLFRSEGDIALKSVKRCHRRNKEDIGTLGNENGTTGDVTAPPLLTRRKTWFARAGDISTILYTTLPGFLTERLWSANTVIRAGDRSQKLHLGPRTGGG